MASSISVRRGRSASTRRGVNACDTRPRIRVCWGGSTNSSMFSDSIRIDGGAPCAMTSRHGLGVATPKRSSRSNASTSACREIM